MNSDINFINELFRKMAFIRLNLIPIAVSGIGDVCDQKQGSAGYEISLGKTLVSKNCAANIFRKGRRYFDI